MKKIALLAIAAAASAIVMAPAANAAAVGSSSTSTITMNVPPVLTITSTNSTVAVDPSATSGTANDIVATITTNYQAGVNVSVKAGATGARSVNTNVGGTGTIQASDISVGGVTGLTLTDQHLAAVQPVLNTATPYNYAVAVGNIGSYPAGNYTNTVLFTLTPQ